MRVEVLPGEARVAEPEDLTRLSVQVAAGVELEGVALELGGALRFESATQAWIDQEWLRSQAGYDAPERRADFDAMVGFARGRGWVDADTGAIAAHVEPAEAQA
jgi:hypothetical protein